jgi:hypothetical protein
MASGSSSASRAARGARAAPFCALGAAGVPGVVCLCALIALLSAAGVAAAGDPTPDGDKPAVAEEVMAELRAAGAARARLLKERQQWAVEKEKLQLLKSTVLREAERHRAAAAAARQVEAKLRKRLAERKGGRQRLESVEAAVDALCERLEKALADLARRSLPGLVPPDRAAGITEPGRRLAAGVERLEEARRRTRRAGVEVVGGLLGERSMAVRLLRAGGVAAWWMSLDGKLAGTAAVRDGQTVLRAVTEPPDVQAIRKAFAMAEGRETPDWALLPVPQPVAKD